MNGIYDLKTEFIPSICDYCKNLFIDQFMDVAICLKKETPNHRKNFTNYIQCIGYKFKREIS